MGDHDSATAPVPAAIGRYQIIHRLGKGGMGEVYLAEDPVLRRRVAIKIMSQGREATPELRARFVREAIAASKLNHPNIATVYDAGETDDGVPFISMEYIDAESLSERLRRERLPVGEAIRIAREVADALHEAHRHGIVHRDIKPANVMLDSRGHAKVLDFGLAKLIGGTVPTDPNAETHAETAVGLVIGTMHYMSPEQTLGARVDHRSDLFSLGVMLYEMLTARHPFVAASVIETIARIREAEPPAVSSIRRDIPPELNSVLARCLAKAPERRYQSGAELITALEAIGTAPVTELKPIDASSATIRRRRFVYAGIAAAVAVIGALAIWLATRQRGTHEAPQSAARSSAPPSVAVLPFVNLSADRENDFFAAGVAEEVIDALSSLENVNVVSRTSSFAFGGHNADIKEIGNKLGVSTIVEGSVRRSGSTIRVRAQLTNVADGFELWTETYERPTNDVFAVQDEIANAVAAQFRARVSPTARSRATGDLAAYDAYLKARQLAATWTPQNFNEAVRLYENAIARDPRFAPAYAGLAELYSLADHRPGLTSLTNEELRRGSMEMAQKALSIDPSSGEAREALGHILIHEGRFADAERELERAIALTPSSATAHLWRGVLRRSIHRGDWGVSDLKKAVQLNPMWAQGRVTACFDLWIAGRFDDVARITREGLLLTPEHAELHVYLALALAMMSQHRDALHEIERAIHADPRPASAEAFRALVLAAAKRRGEALQVLSAIESTRRTTTHYSMIAAYTAAGDVDSAVRWMRRFVEERRSYARGSLEYPDHPLFEPLLSHPEYQRARQSLGLPTSLPGAPAPAAAAQ